MLIYNILLNILKLSYKTKEILIFVSDACHINVLFVFESHRLYLTNNLCHGGHLECMNLSPFPSICKGKCLHKCCP